MIANLPKTVLLMLVTPIDLPIARYALKTLCPLLHEGFQLCIYFNGASLQDQESVRRQVAKYAPYVLFRDNLETILRDQEEIKKQIGTDYITDTGIVALREGLYENCSAVWNRELVKLEGFEIVGIVDADFEVLDPDFIRPAIAAFAEDPQLGFYATDYSPRTRVFCTYSQKDCEVEQRYHTWFCLYRKRALDLDCDFAYVERDNGELVLKSDHSADLQRRLMEDHSFRGQFLRKADRWKYIHYGAFAKNRTLKGLGLYFYRVIRIARHNGYRHIHGSPLLARAVMKLARMIFNFGGLQRFERERSRYPYQKPADSP